MDVKKRALKAAFPHTLPIFAGFTFLGVAYGIYMNSLGFSFLYPMFMSITIFAGSMEFLAANLLMAGFHPLQAFFLTLMVNARHLFYGLSMLEKYKGTGRKKWYLIFGMCDETFSINCSAQIPPDVDAGWFMFFVTLLNHFYWFLGATLGGLLGSLIAFDTQGLDFVMTALFVVIFLDQWFSQEQHLPALGGVTASAACLAALGPDNFVVPAMAVILGLLTASRGQLGKEAVHS